MDDLNDLMTSRSTADAVYDRLYQEIVSLDLLPGSKISEAEVGRRFGVSRQPVRDAFKRLGNIDLLEIRPQRATMVRRFSVEEIENTRFVRLSVELEVIEQACKVWDADCASALQMNLAEQELAIRDGDSKQLHQLDYDFHKLICDLSQRSMAFETINLCKRKVDRLCVLSLAHENEAPAVLNDHLAIALALSNRSTDDARRLVRRHLSRLDATIAEIHEAHSEYFS